MAQLKLNGVINLLCNPDKPCWEKDSTLINVDGIEEVWTFNFFCINHERKRLADV